MHLSHITFCPAIFICTCKSATCVHSKPALVPNMAIHYSYIYLSTQIFLIHGILNWKKLLQNMIIYLVKTQNNLQAYSEDYHIHLDLESLSLQGRNWSLRDTVTIQLIFSQV